MNFLAKFVILFAAFLFPMAAMIWLDLWFSERRRQREISKWHGRVEDWR